MKLLLDTQIALWWLTANKQLKARAKRRIAEAECYLSVVSIWEVAIKYRLGKLPIAPAFFRDAIKDAGVEVLPIIDKHAIEFDYADSMHRDPFDNLLLVIAKVERMKLMTADATLLNISADLTLSAL